MAYAVPSMTMMPFYLNKSALLDIYLPGFGELFGQCRSDLAALIRLLFLKGQRLSSQRLIVTEEELLRAYHWLVKALTKIGTTAPAFRAELRQRVRFDIKSAGTSALVSRQLPRDESALIRGLCTISRQMRSECLGSDLFDLFMDHLPAILRFDDAGLWAMAMLRAHISADQREQVMYALKQATRIATPSRFGGFNQLRSLLNNVEAMPDEEGVVSDRGRRPGALKNPRNRYRSYSKDHHDCPDYGHERHMSAPGRGRLEQLVDSLVHGTEDMREELRDLKREMWKW
jgi:hypothetical protein